MKRFGLFVVMIVSIGFLTLKADTPLDMSFKSDFGNDYIVSSNILENLTFGQSIFFDLPTYNDSLYTLVYISSNNYVLQMNISDAYRVTSKEHITLHFAPKDYYLVLFVSEAGYIYRKEFVLKDAYATLQPEVTQVKPGYQLKSGDTYFYTKDGRSSVDLVTDHSIFYVQYEQVLTNELTITGSNLSITNTSRESGIYVNDVLEVTAPLQSGLLHFNYVYDEHNNIISYHHQFLMTATHDMTLTAYYSEVILEDTPFVYLSPQVDVGLTQVAFSAQLYNDNPDEIVEYGFIYGSEVTLSDPLTYTISRNHNKTSYHAYSKAFSHTIGYIKAYMIVGHIIEGEMTYTTYTSSIKKVMQTYIETFDTLGLSLTSSTPVNGSFTGVTSFDYQKVLSRVLDGPSIVLVQNDSYLLSSTILPITSITFTYKKIAGSTTGLYVNQVTLSGEVTLYTINNITGEVTVTLAFETPITRFKIQSFGSGYIAIDNITWRH